MSDEPPLLVNRDVGDVPHLDARAATRCPMRIHLQIDPPGPLERVPLPDVLRLRLEEGRTFEDAVMTRLRHGVTQPVDVGGDLARTRQAMADRQPLIAGAALRDDVSRRTGRPDLLVALPDQSANSAPVYMPVEIKAHLVVSARASGTLGPLRSVDPQRLAGIDPDSIVPADDRWARRDVRDQMQLAHYHRLLQAAGHAPLDGPAWAGVLGSDFIVALHDLHSRSWGSWRNKTGKWTTLERYDHEFGFRLDVAAVAQQRAVSDSDRSNASDVAQPLVVPSFSSECATCEFHDHCLPHMQAVDEVTLIPGIDWNTRHRLRRDHNVMTASDLARMSLADAPTRGLAAAIDRARVRQVGGRPHRVRGVGDLVLPRADVEVDVDMESSADARVYLWGCLVAGEGEGDMAAPRYVPFSDFSADLDDVALFHRFWQWLVDLRDQTVADGQTFAAYCWAAGGAEDRYLRMYGPLAGVQVEPFIRSPEWVDLHKVVKAHLETGGSFGLKAIAHAVGFTWHDDDPGGAQSMAWYEQARNGDAAMVKRLLAYNADDVAATRAVRDWLHRAWPTLPDVADLTGVEVSPGQRVS